MAKKHNRFELKWNPKGFEELLSLPEVRADLMARAERVRREASENGAVEGYVVTDLVLEETRAAVSIMATGHAHNHNRKHHALLKALDAAKG